MRSISRLAVFAALLGTGLQAHANPPLVGAGPEPSGVPPMAEQAPAIPARATLGEPPRATVVAILQESGQALLWDGVRGEYVLVRAGAMFQDFHVSAISGDQVVLSRGNQHFVLTRIADAPDLRGGVHAAAPAPAAPVAAPAPAAPAPAAPVPAQGVADPYAASGAPPQPIPGIAPFSAQAPVDPYASPAPYAPAQAPAFFAPDELPPAPYAPAPQAPAFFAPDELPPAPGPMDPYVAPAAPAPVAPSLPSSLLESRVKPMPRASTEPRVTSMPRPVIQPQGEAAPLRDEQHTLSRKEFDAAISDFDALGRDMRVAQTADGVRVDEVAAGSLAYRMGVRAGDVVLDVDGKKLRSMSDAAAIYARLMDAEQFAVKVRRGAGIITLRYRFTR
jgi:hypothetical protein